MCAHKELEYLGRQFNRDGEIAFYLYNCKECQSTITSRIKLARNKRSFVIAGNRSKIFSVK